MNATLQSRTQPVARSVTAPSVAAPSMVQRMHSRSRVRRRYDYRALELEAAIKVIVNLILGGAVIAAFTQLIPHANSSSTKLQEIRSEVTRTEHRVNELRDHLNFNFDPQQTRNIMQDVGHRVAPQQYRVVWTQPPTDQKRTR
jgi:cell division protein FtsB